MIGWKKSPTAGQPADKVAQASFPAGTLQPRTLVQVQVAYLDKSPRQYSGNSYVGPDGSLEIGGGFGMVKVGGLTAEQASTQIQQHMSGLVQQPRARLTVLAPPDGVQVVSNWKLADAADEPNGSKEQWQPVIPGGPQTQGATPAQAPAAQPEKKDAGATVAKWQPPPLLGGWQRAPQGNEQAPAPKVLNDNPAPPVVIAVPPPHPGEMVHPPVVPFRPAAPTELKPVSLPTYVIGPPDILQIDSLEGLLTQPVRGPHLVRPDGTIGVGAYGSVYVAGLTLEQTKDAVARLILARLDPEKRTLKDVLDGLSVDVLAYNSKAYYVITDKAGFGEYVERFPVTGYETVLDALSQIKGLQPESSKRHIWVARRTAGAAHKDYKLPVDWCGITQRGETATNYQIMPGDRIYVKAEQIQTINNVLAKFLAPIERLFGVTLLGSQTVNSIRNGTTGSGIR